MWSAGRLAEAAETAERSVVLAGGREAREAALALNVSGDIAMFRGRTEDAVERYRRHGALGDPTGRHVPGLLTALSVAHALINGRRTDEAAAVLADVVPRALRTRKPTTLAWAYYLSGGLVNDRDLARAAADYREAVRCGTPADSRLFVTIARSSAAALAARARDLDEAFVAHAQVLDQWLRLGNAAAAFFLVQHVAVVLARAGLDRDAAIGAGAVRAHIHEMPASAVDAERLEAALMQVRARLGDTTTNTAIAEGEALSIPAGLGATQRALAVRPAQPPSPTLPPGRVERDIPSRLATTPTTTTSSPPCPDPSRRRCRWVHPSAGRGSMRSGGGLSIETSGRTRAWSGQRDPPSPVGTCKGHHSVVRSACQTLNPPQGWRVKASVR